MRQGNAGSFRSGDRSGDTGNNVHVDASVREHEHLFCAPAEHERIPTLQPHDSLALPCRTDHQSIDRLLFDTGSPGALADAEALRARETAERLGIDQGVVQNEIGLFDSPQCAKSPEFRIARTGADQGDSTY